MIHSRFTVPLIVTQTNVQWLFVGHGDWRYRILSELICELECDSVNGKSHYVPRFGISVFRDPQRSWNVRFVNGTHRIIHFLLSVQVLDPISKSLLSIEDDFIIKVLCLCQCVVNAVIREIVGLHSEIRDTTYHTTCHTQFAFPLTKVCGSIQCCSFETSSITSTRLCY